LDQRAFTVSLTGTDGAGETTVFAQVAVDPSDPSSVEDGLAKLLAALDDLRRVSARTEALEPYSADEEEVIERRLRALGYVE